MLGELALHEFQPPFLNQEDEPPKCVYAIVSYLSYGAKANSTTSTCPTDFYFKYSYILRMVQSCYCYSFRKQGCQNVGSTFNIYSLSKQMRLVFFGFYFLTGLGIIEKFNCKALTFYLVKQFCNSSL